MKRRWIWLVIAWVLLDAPLVGWWVRERREVNAETHIREAARRYGVDPALVKAVVWRESRFRAQALGAAGEFGLMQVGELAGYEWAGAEHVDRFEPTDLLDGQTNTWAGTWYLAKLMRRYTTTDNPTAFALADYNAGRANVLRWLKGPAATNSTEFLSAMDFPGTREYVRSILARRDEYAATFPARGL